MQIRVHKDKTTADAVADMLRLNLGDMLEQRDDVLSNITFSTLVSLNADFKGWIVSLIQMSMFASRNDKSSFNIQEAEQVKVPKEFLYEVFSILSDTTKKDFVQYRLDLLAEASKANPSFVEV